MMTRWRACLAASVFLVSAGAASAAPTLTVADSYVGSPAFFEVPACTGGTAPAAPAACGTFISGSHVLRRQNRAPAMEGFTSARSQGNGVLQVLAVGRRFPVGEGAYSIASVARFTETYTYVGAAVSSYVVPFTIEAISLGVLSMSGRHDAGVSLAIRVNDTVVASLDWTATSISDLDPATESVASPLPFGFALPTGLVLSLSNGQQVDQVRASAPGDTILVDLGPKLSGERFTLDYEMRCTATGTLGGQSECWFGDPLSDPPGPPFLLAGAVAVPEPASLAVLMAGAGLLGVFARRRRVPGAA